MQEWLERETGLDDATAYDWKWEIGGGRDRPTARGRKHQCACEACWPERRCESRLERETGLKEAVIYGCRDPLVETLRTAHSDAAPACRRGAPALIQNPL